MRNLTIIAFLMATTSLASAAGNKFFIGQIGDTNNALVGQNDGNNTQNTHPGRQEERRAHLAGHRPARRPTSPTRCSSALQRLDRAQTGGNNTQSTIQGGVGNFAVTTQKGTQTNGKVNNSTTAQFGCIQRLDRRPEGRQQQAEHAAGRRRQLLGNVAGTTAAVTPSNNSSTTADRLASTARVNQTGGNNNQTTLSVGGGNFACHQRRTVSQNAGAHQRIGHAAVRRVQPLVRRPDRRQQRQGTLQVGVGNSRDDRSEHQRALGAHQRTRPRSSLAGQQARVTDSHGRPVGPLRRRHACSLASTSI